MSDDMARRMREKLVKAYDYQSDKLQIEKYAIPILQRAIDRISNSMRQAEHAVPDIEQSIADIQASLELIKQANKVERESAAEAAAALGHILEVQVDADKFVHDMASLATVIQYFDIAAESSVKYWVHLLELVNPDVFRSAVDKVGKSRILELLQ